MTESAAGIRLYDYLEQEFAAFHRRSVRAVLERGGVYVNGLAARKNVRLGAGDEVELRAEPGELVARPRRGGPGASAEGHANRASAAVELPILLESEHALVIAKPAGLPTVPARSGREPGVHGRLQALRPDADLRIVHRLDRDTSGCLILAKGLEAARHFDAQFRAGSVRKLYRALVTGRVMSDQQVIELFLGPDPRRQGKVVAARRLRRGFREARTEVTVERRFRRFTSLLLRPTTGRGHQLRVHLQAIGHPIVGDEAYGGQPLLLSQIKAGYKLRSGVVERPLLERMFLHATEVEFEEPSSGRVVVSAPVPENLQLVLAKLARFGAED